MLHDIIIPPNQNLYKNTNQDRNQDRTRQCRRTALSIEAPDTVSTDFDVQLIAPVGKIYIISR